jgi:hypothetical protein
MRVNHCNVSSGFRQDAVLELRAALCGFAAKVGLACHDPNNNGLLRCPDSASLESLINTGSVFDRAGVLFRHTLRILHARLQQVIGCAQMHSDLELLSCRHREFASVKHWMQ